MYLIYQLLHMNSFHFYLKYVDRIFWRYDSFNRNTDINKNGRENCSNLVRVPFNSINKNKKIIYRKLETDLNK